MGIKADVERRILKEQLIGALIGLARAAEGNKNRPTSKTNHIIISSLKMLFSNEVTNLAIKEQIGKIHKEKNALVPRCLTCSKQCGRNNDYDVSELMEDFSIIRDKKVTILSEILTLAEIQSDGDDDMFPLIYDAFFFLGKKGTLIEIEHIAERVHITLKRQISTVFMQRTY